MVWALAAMAAIQIGAAYAAADANQRVYDAQADLTKANTYSTNTVNTANAYAANTVRSASNEFSAAQASLQSALRSIGNQQKMYVFGQQYNALEENQVRVMDSLVRGNLSQQLKGAATLGALRAQAAAKGTGGASADIMRSVASLAQGASQTTASDNQKYVTFDALLQKQGLLRTAAASLDMGQSLPTLNYGISVAPLAQDPITAADYRSSPLTSALTSWASSGNLAQLLGSFGGTGGASLTASPWVSAAGSSITQSGAAGGSLGDFFKGA